MMQLMSVEKKLELAKSIREDHARNRGLLKRREGFVYDEIPSATVEETTPQEKRGTFGIRLCIGILLGIGFFYMKEVNGNFYGITVEEIQAMITYDVVEAYSIGEIFGNIRIYIEQFLVRI